ncbi:type I-C CRISPR-associated protein Cas8c/Csd1 [Desulfobotulus mexicanus]|uniref:Type I-C CRISPR-associated protein Cas8c/Csd1 n=1 Tax=Desulfobotulus mexicanus TaxID=2586642 RepID=A0A5Q4VDT9_9BACT|nr:type I-C CRISPR-associated protein Cas8c/Csd1 [Desulfobotulus mexicanus]TYT75108.1 type I-C CRISPR-associated protein Cas8c/Csd1 [Desulfobotulus mexicanus]
MILQSLTAFYDRMVQEPESHIPLPGFSNQGIHFCLTLSKEGQLTGDPIDLRVDGKPRQLIVPQAVKRSSGVAANFCWDNTTYVLGADEKNKPEQAKARFEAFKTLFHLVTDKNEDTGVKALSLFLETWNPEAANSLRFWDEMTGSNLVFRLEGDNLFLHQRPAIIKAWKKYLEQDNDTKSGHCLVSGEIEPISRLHPAIKGIPGAQTSGAALVSFNLPSFTSFGKEQNLNAPIGNTATFAYTTALNYLLDRSNRRKIQIGDATTIFWAEKTSPVEDLFSFMVDPDLIHDEGYQSQSTEQDKKELEQKLHAVLKATASGHRPKELDQEDNLFFILGLSPNAARISVRFFHVATVRQLTDTIGLHYRQMEIVKQYDNEPDFISPRRILKALAVREDTKNLSPILSGQLMQAIFTGNSYPRSLLAAVMGRIRAEGKIDRIRSGLIKAILMRNQKMEIPIMLDPENTQTGYVLGRLFAILEKLQEEAVPGTNATIRDKFFSSASATPQRTFHVLLKNAQNHLSKLRKDPSSTGLSITRDKMITDIVAMLDTYPAILSIEDQGLFTLGYYHQKKAFFTKKSTPETVEA